MSFPHLCLEQLCLERERAFDDNGIARLQAILDHGGVADHGTGTYRHGFQCAFRVLPEDHRVAAVTTHAGKLVDAPAFPTDFKIDRHALSTAAAWRTDLVFLRAHATASMYGRITLAMRTSFA